MTWSSVAPKDKHEEEGGEGERRRELKGGGEELKHATGTISRTWRNTLYLLFLFSVAVDLRVKHWRLHSLVISEHHHSHPVLCQVWAVVALRVEEVLGPSLLGTGGGGWREHM